MSFLDQAALANNSDFIDRVTQAAIKSAAAVMAEAGNTAGHRERTNYAVQVLRSPQIMGPLMAQGVVGNPQISAASPDSDIEFTINTLWNAYSGVILPVPAVNP